VLIWDPPRRLLFTWQIGPQREPIPDPDRASEVEVRFSETGDGGTLVAIEHRRFERHGDAGEQYRKNLDLPQGWPYLLACYAKALD
jgi:uncharacterized protein YndB with AHSA1/START domain